MDGPPHADDVDVALAGILCATEVYVSMDASKVDAFFIIQDMCILIVKHSCRIR